MIVAASGAQNFREWLLAGGTVVLAVVTMLLWLATKRMAEQAGEAARAAAQATDGRLDRYDGNSAMIPDHWAAAIGIIAVGRLDFLFVRHVRRNRLRSRQCGQRQ